MQKLVTIFLYAINKSVKHGTVEEHLVEQLADGWRIVSVSSSGGAGEMYSTSAWVTVVLEKGRSQGT
jgi:hypothetical protein